MFFIGTAYADSLPFTGTYLDSSHSALLSFLPLIIFMVIVGLWKNGLLKRRSHMISSPEFHGTSRFGLVRDLALYAVISFILIMVSTAKSPIKQASFNIFLPLAVTLVAEPCYVALFYRHVSKTLIARINLLTVPVSCYLFLLAEKFSDTVIGPISNQPFGHYVDQSQYFLAYFADLGEEIFGFLYILSIQLLVMWIEFRLLARAYPDRRKEMARLSFGMNAASATGFAVTVILLEAIGKYSFARDGIPVSIWFLLAGVLAIPALMKHFPSPLPKGKHNGFKIAQRSLLGAIILLLLAIYAWQVCDAYLIEQEFIKHCQSVLAGNSISSVPLSYQGICIGGLLDGLGKHTNGLPALMLQNFIDLFSRPLMAFLVVLPPLVISMLVKIGVSRISWKHVQKSLIARMNMATVLLSCAAMFSMFGVESLTDVLSGSESDDTIGVLIVVPSIQCLVTYVEYRLLRKAYPDLPRKSMAWLSITMNAATLVAWVIAVMSLDAIF